MESLVINCETGEETRVPYTKEQIAEVEALGVITQTELQTQKQAKESAAAKLEALGLSLDDLKALGL